MNYVNEPRVTTKATTLDRATAQVRAYFQALPPGCKIPKACLQAYAVRLKPADGRVV